MLEKRILVDLLPQDRINTLVDTAYESIDYTYAKKLTKEELELHKDSLADVQIKLSEKEDELADIKAQFQLKIKPLKEKSKVIADILKHESVSVTERVYLMADYRNNMMGYYNKDGVLVDSRPLESNEMQLKINKAE